MKLISIYFSFKLFGVYLDFEMSSKVIDKKHHEIRDDTRDSFQVRNVIIPFSLIFGNQETYIYSGDEKMPFSKRLPLYRAILLNEFKE